MKKKIALILLLIIIGGGYYTWTKMDRIIKASIERFAPKYLGVPVSVQNVDVSPFTGEGSLKVLVIGNPEGFKSDFAIKLRGISIKMDPKTLIDDTIIINNITVDKPEIIYELSNVGNNLETLKKNASKGKPKSNTDEELAKKVIVEYMLIKDGTVRAGFGNSKATLPLPDIELRNIGKEEGGTSFAKAGSKVVTSIIKNVNTLNLAPLTNSMKAVLNPAKSITDSVKNTSDTLKGLFGRKNKDENTEEQ